MPRIPDPTTLTPEQQIVHDRIAAGPRGTVRGPLAVWLHRPDLADRAQALGEYCRYGSSLSPRLSELAILVTARIWAAEYEWFAHKQHALTAGLDPAIIEAIRTNQPPTLPTPEDQAVYDVATILNTTRRLTDPQFATALETLGRDRLVDLIGVLGYYALISMTINAFAVDYPGPPQLS